MFTGSFSKEREGEQRKKDNIDIREALHALQACDEGCCDNCPIYRVDTGETCLFTIMRIVESYVNASEAELEAKRSEIKQIRHDKHEAMAEITLLKDALNKIGGPTTTEATTTKIQMHKEICDSIHHLYECKNHDYGDSFGESFREFGFIAALVRMEDKFNRLKQLHKNEAAVKDETMQDTLLDLANYSIMAALELKER